MAKLPTLYVPQNTYKLTENKPYTCFIKNVSTQYTSRDLKITLDIAIISEKGLLDITDIIYDSHNYAKRIKAIYSALDLPEPTSESYKADLNNSFPEWKNKLFQVTFKKNVKGYYQPYMYIRPNTTIDEKWNTRGFGERTGKVYNEMLAEELEALRRY